MYIKSNMMSATDDNNDNFMSCANCGKEGNNLNACNRCNVVKYCNAACKKKHRSKHKKKCDRRVAEMHDEASFKQPPQLEEDCPICFMRMPSMSTGKHYHSCCGKVICSGCTHAVAEMDGNVDQLCPFCRTPAAKSDEEVNNLLKKRMKLGDAVAMYSLGCCYANGRYGLQQEMDKALELWHRAGELGYATAYYNIGNANFNGLGVERDMKKATHYYELAAIRGSVNARHNLGNAELRAGNIDRAMKHFMIAVESGSNKSLKMIKQLYSKGYATKDDYANALRAYQAYLKEIKSDDRDKAAAYSDKYKYYE